MTLTPEELLDLIKYDITINSFVTITYRVNGEIHRDNDLPAVIQADGTKWWYIDNKLHRDNDQPAVIDADGTKYWYIDGKFIRRELTTYTA